MRSYELVLVLNPDINDEETKKLTDSVISWLGKAEVELKKLGKKALAYQIKKQREGVYFLLNIAYTNEAIVPADLQKKLLAQNGVLRHLLIRKEGAPKAEKKVKRSKKGGNKKS